MNLSKAEVVSKDIVLRIRRFTWDSSNYRSSVPLVPHQLHLFIFSGCDFYLSRLYTFLGTKLRENLDKLRSKALLANSVRDLSRKYNSYYKAVNLRVSYTKHY